MRNPVHHIELWTHDLDQVEASFGWLLPRLGWAADHDPAWPQGRVWRHASGAYVTLEESPAVTGPHDRMRAGLNHLALCVEDRPTLDALRAEAAGHAWSELFADAYPHAGGPGHTALFVENVQGFELEIVVA
ncbi:glyoxalase [Serinicoccus sp. CNJ-927]|uniref:VOC family protein n=1 Tax=Serinicoccus sp. CNJ-927 TaxID=1904970 RepID=UPI0009636F29|nr:VOC family protein [Serinicoccus sp. CNJ-927]OLT40295.1 glyoxalase [Serinicoccus sp. CNJ-927]